MSSVLAENLSREKVRQLLAAIGSGAVQDTTQIEAAKYDWHQPHYFTSSQLTRLNNFTKRMAAIMAEKFAQLYHSDFNATITSVTQHFAGELLEQISSSGQNDYYLAFGPDQENLCGLISVGTQTAIAWVRQLLGDAEHEKDTKDTTSLQATKALSQLEESLLFDITSALVESLAIALPTTGGPQAGYNLQPAKAIVKGSAFSGTIKLQDIEEICKIIFRVEKAAPASDESTDDGQAYFLIPCSKLAPIVGKTICPWRDNEFSADDVSKAILDHLQRMPVSVMAQLGSTVLTFEQIIDLRPCDILLLDKAIDEPIELIVEGRTVFRGQPAKSAGQHAVVIS